MLKISRFEIWALDEETLKRMQYVPEAYTEGESLLVAASMDEVGQRLPPILIARPELGTSLKLLIIEQSAQCLKCVGDDSTTPAVTCPHFATRHLAVVNSVLGSINREQLLAKSASA